MSDGTWTDTVVFVCFEGGEGAGKSTQATALAAWLTEAGYAVRLTFEPGDTPVGKQLRAGFPGKALADQEVAVAVQQVQLAARRAEPAETTTAISGWSG